MKNTSDTSHYDLIVIGSGAGLNVAAHAAQHNEWKVALIEEGPMGGTCLNRGCIPSKIIIHAADVAETIERAATFGISARIDAVDFADITRRASTFVDGESNTIEKNVRESDVFDLYKERASFVDAHTIVAGEKKLTADRYCIAAGARPFVTPNAGLDTVEYMTSTEALRQETQPASMIIIGGGYIATELGHFYGALGTKVTIVERGDALIKREDKDVSETFTRLFSQKHNILLGHTAKKVEQKGSEKIVTVTDKEGSEKTIAAEALLVAVGIQPNTDLLRIENTTIETDERGYIKVNEYLETTQKNVWALGDIIGIAPFRHAANWQAQHVIRNIHENGKVAVDHSVMPRAIFSSPQVAGVGITEQEAQEKGISHEVRRSEYKKTGMGKALEEKDGFVKFIIDPDRQKILGCFILGPDASTLIHEVVVAMAAAGGDIKAITSTIHIHPALSEVVQRALY